MEAIAINQLIRSVFHLLKITFAIGAIVVAA